MIRSGRYDVVVVGGGAAGVGAAVGAARRGAAVCLIERAPYLGGAATHSQVATYCGFWTQAERPQRAVCGVGESVLDEIAELGGDVTPRRMPRSNVVVALIDPETVKYALDRVTARERVDVILHAQVTEVRADGDEVHAVGVTDHGGTWWIEGATFVDASGDADLAARAHAGVRFGDDRGLVQNGTLVMRIGGIASDAIVTRAAWEEAIVAAKARGVTGLTKEYSFVARIPPSDDAFTFLADEAFDARDARSLTAAERSGRAQAWVYLSVLRELPGHENAYLVSTGPQIGTRESRHIVARYRLTDADVLEARRAHDGIALGAWPVEYHPGPGRPNLWRRIAGEGAYEIPLRTLRSATHRNLFAAGRTIDAEAHAFASARVMGTGFATGEAAGVAAAAVASEGDADPERVRDALRAQGALVTLPDARGLPA